MKVKSDHRSKFSNLSNWREEAGLSVSSVLYQHIVILHRPYPLSCQLYFVYLAVFHLSVLLDDD